MDEFVDCASITCCGNEIQLLQTRTLKCFPDGLGTSWKVNFHRMSCEIVYIRSHLEKQLAVDTLLPCQYLSLYVSLRSLGVFADAVDKFPRPSIFPRMSASLTVYQFRSPTLDTFEASVGTMPGCSTLNVVLCMSFRLS